MFKRRFPKAQLSAQDLSDVPPSVRMGSPYDAPDRDVYRALKKGFFHPRANYGVVYRNAFAPVLGSGEEPAKNVPGGTPVEGWPTGLVLRFMMIVPPEKMEGWDPNLRTDDISGGLGGWVLLTTQAIRWHYSLDAAPHLGIEPRLGAAPGGPRLLRFEDAEEVVQTPFETHHPLAGILHLDFVGFSAAGEKLGFLLSGQPGGADENRTWYEYVVASLKTHNPSLEVPPYRG